MTAGARARRPWEDELGRLRWLESRGFTTLATAWRQRAAGLRETMTGAADQAARDLYDDRAATWEQAAEELGEIVGASHAGGVPAAGDVDWAMWHTAELGRHLEALKQAWPGADRPVLDEVGAPE
jgi:hypothetical protein